MGFFERLKEGLSKTRRNFTDRIQELVGLSAAIDDDFLIERPRICERLSHGTRQGDARFTVESFETIGRGRIFVHQAIRTRVASAAVKSRSGTWACGALAG